MKYRIKHIKKDYRDYYVPQYKTFLFWKTFYEDGGDSSFDAVYFSNKIGAEEFIELVKLDQEETEV